MCISAAGPKTHQAVQVQPSSSLHHNKGEHALYILLEDSVHVIWPVQHKSCGQTVSTLLLLGREEAFLLHSSCRL